MVNNFDSWINEKRIRFGTLDDFDMLSDPQQLVMLVVLGMLKFSEHMTYHLELNDTIAVLTTGGRGKDWEIDSKDKAASEILERAIELLAGDKNLSSMIVYKKGSRTIRISK